MKKPSLSILIPVRNEEKNLLQLFRALEKQNFKNFEVIFVNNNSSDSSLKLLKTWAKQKRHFFVFVEQEKRIGFAPPLIRAVKKAKSPFLAILDADCLPQMNWAKNMYESLTQHSLVVGETNNLLSKNPSTSERLAEILFHNYSYNTAHAIGHAMPWGPTCNLGVRKKLFQKTGPFSLAAGAAFDLDWCWRAVLQGTKIHYETNAKVFHKRKKEEEDFLNQIYRYGTGEAWVQKTYAFLQHTESQKHIPNPPLAAQLGAERFFHSFPKNIRKKEPYATLLRKASTAFACGIVEGYLGKKEKQKKKEKPKSPKSAIFLNEEKKTVTVLVPGKGILQLTGAGKELWHNFEQGKKLSHLAAYLQSNFRINGHDAFHEAKHFLEAIHVEQK